MYVTAYSSHVKTVYEYDQRTKHSLICALICISWYVYCISLECLLKMHLGASSVEKPTPRYSSFQSEVSYQERYLQSHVHCCTVPSDQDEKSLSVHRWMKG